MHDRRWRLFLLVSIQIKSKNSGYEHAHIVARNFQDIYYPITNVTAPEEARSVVS